MFIPSTLRPSGLGVLTERLLHGLLRKFKHLYKKKRECAKEKEKGKKDSSSGIRIFEATYENFSNDLHDCC